ncbi:MAG: ankyrin repeat domain-containing protein [Candidatus Micrarchaeota archaeon]|nr:ankyrin repeat domain-containing protein [Candidatus Micrarchaeota archaeon]
MVEKSKSKKPEEPIYVPELKPKTNYTVELPTRITPIKPPAKIKTEPKEGQNELNKLLLASVNEGNVLATKRAINAGANVNVINIEGDSPLTIAIEKGNVKIVRLLLDNGATISKELERLAQTTAENHTIGLQPNKEAQRWEIVKMIHEEIESTTG